MPKFINRLTNNIKHISVGNIIYLDHMDLSTRQYSEIFGKLALDIQINCLLKLTYESYISYINNTQLHFINSYYNTQYTYSLLNNIINNTIQNNKVDLPLVCFLNSIHFGSAESPLLNIFTALTLNTYEFLINSKTLINNNLNIINNIAGNENIFVRNNVNLDF